MVGVRRIKKGLPSIDSLILSFSFIPLRVLMPSGTAGEGILQFNLTALPLFLNFVLGVF
jgi:hypothetical protein